jgi:hypothetical protein
MDFLLGEIFGAVLCLFLAAPLVILIAGMLIRFDVDHDGKEDI